MGKLSFKERLNELEPLIIQSVPVLDSLELIQTPSEEATIEEAEKLWPILEASLDLKLGYGLTAIQIGIKKKIGFIKYQDKDYRLLNTRITNRHGETLLHGEGCLSIPGKTFNTLRSSQITIEDDIQGKFILTESSDGLLTLIFQHEVDHFEGITLYDRQRKPVVNTSPKIGRNDLCPCGSNKKYKKCCID